MKPTHATTTVGEPSTITVHKKSKLRKCAVPQNLRRLGCFTLPLQTTQVALVAKKYGMKPKSAHSKADKNKFSERHEPRIAKLLAKSSYPSEGGGEKLNFGKNETNPQCIESRCEFTNFIALVRSPALPFFLKQTVHTQKSNSNQLSPLHFALESTECRGHKNYKTNVQKNANFYFPIFLHLRHGRRCQKAFTTEATAREHNCVGRKAQAYNLWCTFSLNTFKWKNQPLSPRVYFPVEVHKILLSFIVFHSPGRVGGNHGNF